MRAKLLHIIRTVPLFLVLLPLFFMLHGLRENYAPGLVPVALGQAVIYCLAGIAITLLFYPLLKSVRKAALVSLLLLAFNFFFGAIHDLMIKELGRNALPTRYTFIIPFILIILTFFIIWLRKRKKEPTRSIIFFNVLFLVLLLYDLFLVISTVKIRDNYDPRSLAASFRNCDTCNRPDVYVIIADEYAGKQELKEIFNFDNSAFEQELQKRGFHIAGNTISNYNATVYSMASLFSMDYLQLLGKGLVTQQDMLHCRNIIRKNNVLSFFTDRGYQVRNFSFFSLHDQPKAVNNYYFPPKRKIFTSQTFINRFRKEVEYNFFSKQKAERVAKNDFTNDEIVDSLTKRSVIENKETPQFVYSHFTRPHHPYYVDRNGKAFSHNDSLTGFARLQKEYTEHLLYTNDRLLQLIDHIRSNSSRPPVILLASDHGFRQFMNEQDRKYYFMNFCAVSLPSGNYNGFYNGVSSVNTFRIILNTEFGQRLPLLKDSSSFILEKP